MKMFSFRPATAGLLAIAVAASTTLATVGQNAPATPPTTAPATPPAAPAGGQPSKSLSTSNDSRTAVPTAPQAGQVVEESTDDLPPPVVLDPPVCDFGFVAPAAAPLKKVKIKNTSDKPLLILASQPSCKCTTTNDISGEEIPPGGEIELEASMKAQSSPGPKKAEIKILFDGYARVVNLQLLMEVALPIRAVPGFINAVRNQPQQGRLVVESLDKQPFSIAAIHGRPVKFVGFDPKTDAPKNQYLVEYDVTEFKPEEMPLFLLIETDRADCPIVDVRLRHEATFPKPVLKMQDYRHTIGKIEQGGSAELHFEIAELPDNEPVVSLASTMPGAKLEILETTKDGIMTKIHARFTAPKDFQGLLYAPITLYTSRRQQGMFVWGLVTPTGHKGTLGTKMVPAGGASMRYVGDGATTTAAPAAAPATPATTAAPAAPATPAAPADGLGNRPTGR